MSESRAELLRVLENSGFQVQEFLVNPNQLNIPNSRLRYIDQPLAQVEDTLTKQT